MTIPTLEAQSPPVGYKVLYTVPEVMVILSLSRSRIYTLIRSGRLRTVKEGGARRVPSSAITDYVALLEREAEVA